MKKILLFLTFCVIACATYAQRAAAPPKSLKLSKDNYSLTLPEGRVQFHFDQKKIVVKFRDGFSQENIVQLFAKTGYFKEFKKEWEAPFPKVIRAELKDQPGLTYEQAAAALESDPNVLYTAPILLYRNSLEQCLYDLFYVKLKDAADLALLRNYATQNGFTIEKEYEHNIYFCRVTKASAGNSFEISSYLQSLNKFEYAEPDFIYTCKNETNDPNYPNQWALNNTGQYSGTPGADMDIENAWYLTTGSPSVKVAIIDCFGSAAQFTHPDITFFATHDATGTGFTANGYSGEAHGINCAGIIKATANNALGSAGIAYNANVIAVKVGTISNNSGNWNSTGNSISDGITWAYQNADVLSNSNSFGSSSSLINNAIANAVTLGRGGKGSPVFSSAGNNNTSTIAYPASNANTIAVIATSMCDKRKTPTSCDGENWWGSDYGTGADVAAPGVQIATTDIAGAAGYSAGDYSTGFNGTSAACPMAAGVMALILSEKPSLTYTAARFALESTCEKVGGYTYNSGIANQPNGTWTSNMGYGRVNAYAALQTICTSSNDDCSTASTLPVGSSCSYTQGSLCGATHSMAPITCGSFTASSALDVWYAVTPTTSNLSIKCLPGAGTDIVIGLYSGSCGNLALVQCADNNAASLAETINATGLTTGAVYYVRVYSYNGNGTNTNFQICASCYQPNDLCANATGLTVGSTCNYVNGNLCGATQTLAPLTCNGFTSSAALDVWYAFTPTQAGGGVTVKCQSGISSDIVLALYSGTCSNPTLITCSDGTGTAGLETVSAGGLNPGTVYYIRVYNYGGNNSGTDFQICAMCSETNDNCATAASLPVLGTCSYQAGNLCGATQSMPPITCNGFTAATANDIWYAITPSASNLVINCQSGTSSDVVLSLYGGSCGALNLLQCSDATANGGLETLNLSDLTAGTTYYVRVYNYNANSGGTDFQICAAYDPPVVTLVSPTSICQGGNVDISYSVQTSYPSGNVFTAQLSNSAGSFANPTTIGSLTSTTSGIINAVIPATQAAGLGYRVRVISSNPAFTGANNGINLTIIALPAAASTVISPSGTPAFCTGSQVTLSVPSNAGYSYQWKLGGNDIPGATNNTYAAGVAGGYTVLVTNASGCSRLSSVRNVTENALPPATISPSAMQNLCPGQTVTLQANTGAGLSYQWFQDNAIITGATSSSYNTGTAGTYTVQVTKTNGCSAMSAGVVVTNACAAVIADAGNLTLCTGSGLPISFNATGFNAGNVFTLQLSAAGGSFASPTDIGTLPGTSGGFMSGVIPSGTPVGAGYKLRVVSSDPVTAGPASPLTLKIQSATIDPISLCAVTVSSNKNLLVWDKPMTANIDSFVIYRNTQVTGVYQKIAAQEYAAFSTYLDNTADPTTQPYRYYITGENMCGEGPQYNPHRTIHLTINKGQGSTKWNLIWNGYEGFTHGTYQIWRGANAGSLSLLAEVEANSYNSFTDLNAPTGALFYRVVVGDAPSCNPSARTTGGEMVGSNIVSNSEDAVNLSWMDMNVWPNPGTTSSQLMVVSSSQDDVYNVRIVDITGRVLDHYEAAANKAIEFGRSYAPGVYTIEAFSKDGQKLVRKWVKQ